MKRPGFGFMSSQFEVMYDSNPKFPAPIKEIQFLLHPSELDSYSQLTVAVRSLYPHLLVQWKLLQVYCASKEVVTKQR